MDKLNNTLKSNVSILWNKMDEVNLTLQETVLHVDSLNNSLGIKLTYYLNCTEVSIIALESLVGSTLGCIIDEYTRLFGTQET